MCESCQKAASKAARKFDAELREMKIWSEKLEQHIRDMEEYHINTSDNVLGICHHSTSAEQARSEIKEHLSNIEEHDWSEIPQSLISDCLRASDKHLQALECYTLCAKYGHAAVIVD